VLLSYYSVNDSTNLAIV